MAQESWKRDQDETGCQHPEGPIPEGPILCINNCGFFGSATTMNLCSKCYRDIVLKQSGVFSSKVLAEKSMVVGLGDKSLVFPTQVEKPNCMAMLTDVSMPLADAPLHLGESTFRQEEQQLIYSPNESLEQPGPSTVLQYQHSSPAVNRCFTCRKRVGLTGFKCRCGDIFCSLHRYSDKHSCSFDYKAAGRDAIAKANPVVKAGKIEKI